ncbi:MAG: hypothetical protein HYR76_11850 [Ignavibacteria bacterium]|nr:hypothetical protein [Ignavibacteria bacterium]
MKDLKRWVALIALGIVCSLFVFSSISCQYDYASPLPGTLEIHLKTISNKIPFSPLNNFVLKVSQVQALRSSLTSGVVIYADPRAKSRTTSIYNTLDFRARDSSLVIGQSPVPPGDYIDVELVVTPGDKVNLNGYQIIPVVAPPGFDPLLVFPKRFSVSELSTTVITLTIDLDCSLVPGATAYYFRPCYFISSIQ